MATINMHRLLELNERLLEARSEAEDVETRLIDELTEDLAEWLAYLTEPANARRSDWVQSMNVGMPHREDLRDLEWRIEDLDPTGWWFENGTFPFGGGGLFMPLEWVTDSDAWIERDQAEAVARIAAERNRLINELAERERALEIAQRRLAASRSDLNALSER